jgi:hypothetical protein
MGPDLSSFLILNHIFQQVLLYINTSSILLTSILANFGIFSYNEVSYLLISPQLQIKICFSLLFSIVDFPNRRLKATSSSNNFQRMMNPQAGIAANSHHHAHADYELYKQYYFGTIGNQFSLAIPPLRRPSNGSLHDLMPRSGASSPSNSLPSTPRIGEDGGGEEIEVRQKNRIWDWYRRHMNHSPFASPREGSPRTTTATNGGGSGSRLLRRSITSMQSVFGFGNTSTVPAHNQLGHVHSIRVQPVDDSIHSVLSSPRESINASPSLASQMMLHEEYDELDQPWESASRIRPINNASPMLR